jgi:hypothetical protein
MSTQSSTRQAPIANRTSTLVLSRGRANYAALKEATCRMWRALRGVPKSVQNVVYGFTRAESKTKRGHLMGSWPEVARACAMEGAPLIDVMAPVYEVERQLRREIYRNHTPSLRDAELAETQAAFNLRTAEIENDPRKIIEAAIDERAASQVLLEVVEMSVVS